MYENILPEDYQGLVGRNTRSSPEQDRGTTDAEAYVDSILHGGYACPETVGLQPNGSSTFTAPARRTGNIHDPESLCSASIGAALS